MKGNICAESVENRNETSEIEFSEDQWKAFDLIDKDTVKEYLEYEIKYKNFPFPGVLAYIGKKPVLVYPASCGGGCFCAAVWVELK